MMSRAKFRFGLDTDGKSRMGRTTRFPTLRVPTATYLRIRTCQCHQRLCARTKELLRLLPQDMRRLFTTAADTTPTETVVTVTQRTPRPVMTTLAKIPIEICIGPIEIMYWFYRSGYWFYLNIYRTNTKSIGLIESHVLV